MRDKTMRDKPWIFRTYAGHSTARDSNALYRGNLAKGQTGLSVAFDLPTQTGYDSDHVLARGEVGKVGVPISHLGDMRALFDGIPLASMNTSMTINATAAWLMALYIAVADEQGAPRSALTGTIQNDIIKEYLSRGTYVFPPAPSMRLIKDVAIFTTFELPKWNPMNICSYHLQEAGATPVQELAFALATAIAVLDTVKASGEVTQEKFGEVVGRISFFVNAGLRFITEMCKMRAFVELWDEITRERYGVRDAELRRFRYGVQVNSLGLTESQPENNAIRIALEALGVTLSKQARCRALQLPAWNEALGLPRPWDQQWSLRIQQILAYETDLLEYEDLFDGSKVVEARTRELREEARAELDRVLEMGGAVAAVENAWMKQRLVESQTRRSRAIEQGEQVVVGVTRFTEAEPSPLVGSDQAILRVDEGAEQEQVAKLAAFRARRSRKEVDAALRTLRDVASGGGNVMQASIRAAHAGVTTGEWADVLRELLGEYRAPTGVGARSDSQPSSQATALRTRVHALSERLGRPLKILVGKPGLDGHSNGAEQIAVRARDAGLEVVYEGIRLTPEQIVRSARDEGVHLIGLSILSGSHVILVLDVLSGLRKAGLESLPLVVGGIIPEEDAETLRQAGVRRVYTPKDYDLTRIMGEIVDVVAESAPAA
jgi:(2R)-ethylmalonyl-CoA mutase